MEKEEESRMSFIGGFGLGPSSQLAQYKKQVEEGFIIDTSSYPVDVEWGKWIQNATDCTEMVVSGVSILLLGKRSTGTVIPSIGSVNASVYDGFKMNVSVNNGEYSSGNYSPGGTTYNFQFLYGGSTSQAAPFTPASYLQEAGVPNNPYWLQNATITAMSSTIYDSTVIGTTSLTTLPMTSQPTVPVVPRTTTGTVSYIGIATWGNQSYRLAFSAVFWCPGLTLINVATDSTGIYVCGRLSQTTGLPTGFPAFSGSNYGFVCKYAKSTGNVVWARYIGIQQCRYVALSPDNTKVYIFGNNNTGATSATNSTVACLNATDGSILWSQTLAFTITINNITGDNSGVVYLAGSGAYSSSYNPKIDVASNNFQNGLIIKMSKDGVDWGKWIQGSTTSVQTTTINRIALLGNDVYVCGNSNTSLSMFDTKPSGTQVAFYAKLSIAASYYSRIARPFYNLFQASLPYINFADISGAIFTVASYSTSSGTPSDTWLNLAKKDTILTDGETAFISLTQLLDAAFKKLFQDMSGARIDISGVSTDIRTAATTPLPALKTDTDSLQVATNYVTTGISCVVGGGGTGATNSIITTEDGITWIARGLPLQQTMGIAFNGSIWVAVGLPVGTGNTIFTSTDGITWVGRNSILNSGALSVAWSKEQSLWIAVGIGTNDSIVTSIDGITWTARGGKTGLFSAGANKVLWTGSTWFVLGETSTGAGFAITTTPTVTNSWILAYSINRNGGNIKYGFAFNGTNILAASGNSWQLYNPNNLQAGATSSSFSTSGGFANALDAAWNGSMWMVVGYSTTGNNIFVSSTGMNWQGRGMPLGQYVSGITWNPMMQCWVATTYTGSNNSTTALATSKDNGVTWSRIVINTPMGFSVACKPSTHFISLLPFLRNAVTAAFSSYQTMLTTASSARVTIPTKINYTQANEQTLMDSTTGPFEVVQSTALDTLLLPTLKSTVKGVAATITVDVTGQTNPAKNGTYVITSTAHSSGSVVNNIITSFDGSTTSYNGIPGSGSTVGTLGVNVIVIKIPTPMNIISCHITSTLNASSNINRYPDSYAYTLDGSNDGNAWILITSNTAKYSADRALPFSKPSYKFSYFRITIPTPNNIISRVDLFEYKGIATDTKQDQFLQLVKKYNDASTELNALIEASKFQTNYTEAIKYVTVSDLSSSTVALNTAITNQTPITINQVLAGRRDILQTVVSKYYQWNPTLAAATSLTSLNIPTNPIPTALPSNAVAADTMTAATSTQMDTAYTKFLDPTTGLWPLLQKELPRLVFPTISEFYWNTYAPARQFVEDADLSGVNAARQSSINSMNADGTMAMAFTAVYITFQDIVARYTDSVNGIRQTVAVLQDKYAQRTGTTITDAITSTTSNSAVLDLRRKYLDLWAAVLTAARTKVSATIANYEIARDATKTTTGTNFIPQTATSYAVTDATYAAKPAVVLIDKDVVKLAKRRVNRTGVIGSVQYKFGSSFSGTSLFPTLPTAAPKIITSDADSAIITATAFSSLNSSSRGEADALAFFRSTATALDIGRSYSITIDANTPISIVSIVATLSGSGIVEVKVNGYDFDKKAFIPLLDLSGSSAVTTGSLAQRLSTGIWVSTESRNKYLRHQMTVRLVSGTASLSNMVLNVPNFSSTLTISELKLVEDTEKPYIPALEGILTTIRANATKAITDFQTTFKTTQMPQGYETIPSYSKIVAANTNAATDLDTIPTTQNFNILNGFVTSYQQATSDLTTVVKFGLAQTAITNFASTQTEVRKFVTDAQIRASALWTDISGALGASQTITAATPNIDSVRGSFEKGTSGLVTALISQYTAYRNQNLASSTDTTLRTSQQSAADSASITASNAVSVRDNYIQYWLAMYRVEVKLAMNAFTTEYAKITVPIDTNPLTQSVQSAFDLSKTDSTAIDALTDAAQIQAKKAYYQKAATDLVTLVKRAQLLQAINTFQATKAATDPYITTQPPAAVTATTDLPNVLTGSTIAATLTTNADIDAKRTQFEAGTNALVGSLLDSYKSYRATVNDDSLPTIAQADQAKATITTDKAQSTLTTYLASWTGILKADALQAISNFTREYNASAPFLPSDVAANGEYTTAQTAFAAADADRTTIAALTDSKAIFAKKTTYMKAQTDLIQAVKRSRLLKAVTDFTTTKAATDPYITTQPTAAITATTDLPTVLTGNSIVASLTDSETLDSKRAQFETGTTALVGSLLDAYKTYRPTVNDATLLTDATVDAAKSTITVQTAQSVLTTYVGNWLTMLRSAAKLALTAFSEEYAKSTVYFPLDVATNAEYKTARDAFATSAADQTDINTLTDPQQLSSKRTTYKTALTDLVKAVKRSRLLKAVQEFQKTLTATTTGNPAFIAEADLKKTASWSDISGAKGQVSTLVEGDKLKEVAEDQLVTKRTIFETATRKLVLELIAAYKIFRDKNASTYTDILDAARTDAELTQDKTDVEDTNATLDEILTKRTEYTTSYWPTLVMFGTKTSSRLALIAALTRFADYYVHFIPVMEGTSYTNAALAELYTYVDSTKFLPLPTVLSQASEKLQQITDSYRNAYYTALVEDVRGLLRKGMQAFFKRKNDTAAIVSRSGITVPTSLPTVEDAVDGMSDGELKTTLTAYYNNTNGHWIVLEELISAAILENKRQDVITALRTFTAAYESTILYIDPVKLSSVANTAYSDATTYFAEGARTTQFAQIPIGTIGDNTSTTLYSLQSKYEAATREVAAAMIRGLQSGYAEKAALKQVWSPSLELINQATATAPSSPEDVAKLMLTEQTSLSTVGTTHDTYSKFWVALNAAAQSQLTTQIGTWKSLDSFVAQYSIPVTESYTKMKTTLVNTDIPTKDTKFYTLESIYQKYDQAGTELVTSINEWERAQIAEYGLLLSKYTTFQKDPEVGIVRNPANANFVNTTAETDVSTLNTMTYYTNGVVPTLSSILTKYSGADGLLSRLRSFVRGELVTYVDAFNNNWKESKAETREVYTSYEADRLIVGNAGANTNELISVMANYTTYTDDLYEANLQESVLVIMRDFNQLMLDNVEYLSKDTTKPRVQQIQEAQGKISGYVDDILKDKDITTEKDALRDSAKLKEIREEYFKATYTLAEQLAEDLNLQQDAYYTLYQTYRGFILIDRKNDANKIVIAAPVSLSNSIQIDSVKPQEDGPSKNKVELDKKLNSLLASKKNTNKETIQPVLGGFADQLKVIRESVIPMYTKLREEITSALRTYIDNFGISYKSLAIQDVNDPYTTGEVDANIVKEGVKASTPQLMGLIASYTKYTEDLITSDIQVRVLQAIHTFFTDLYVANREILPTASEVKKALPAIQQQLDDALSMDTLVARVVSNMNAQSSRADLQELRTKYMNAANALAPYIIQQLLTLIAVFDSMYTKYTSAYTAAQAFFSKLSKLPIENPSASQKQKLELYGIVPQYSENLRNDINEIRKRVLADTETLREFVKTQVTAYVEEYSKRWYATTSSTLSKNASGYGIDTLATDKSLITGGKFIDLSALLDKYAILIQQLEISQKQQTLFDTITRFKDELLTPNLEFIPAITGEVNTKNGQVEVDRVTSIPALEGTTEQKLETLSAYSKSIDSLQAEYESAIKLLLNSIRNQLTTILDLFEKLYSANIAVIRSEVSDYITSAYQTCTTDKGAINDVSEALDINRFRDKYVFALETLFETVKYDISVYVYELDDLKYTYEEFLLSNSLSEDIPNMEQIPPNIIVPTVDIANSAYPPSDAFLKTVDSLRISVILPGGLLPQLRNFIRDQLYTYIINFKNKYDEVSRNTDGFKKKYEAIQNTGRDISGTILEYSDAQYEVDLKTVASDASPSYDDLKALINSYKNMSVELITTNVQYRVGTLVFNFLQFYISNSKIITLADDSEIKRAVIDAVGNDETPGIAYQIANNLNTEEELQNRSQLSSIESSYLQHLSDLVTIVKESLNSILDDYELFNQVYTLFYNTNKDLFESNIVSLNDYYAVDTVAYRNTLNSFTTYSDSLVAAVDQIRIAMFPRLLSIRKFISGELVKYVNAFKIAYETTTSRTLQQNLPNYLYTNDISKTETDALLIMQNYLLYSQLLLLSQKEELAYDTIDSFKRLYTPLQTVLKTKSDTLVTRVEQAEQLKDDAIKPKNVIEKEYIEVATEGFQNELRQSSVMDVLPNLMQNVDLYTKSNEEIISLSKNQFITDLSGFKTLYLTYDVFSKNEDIKKVYDLSGIPTSISNITGVTADIIKLENIGTSYTLTVEETINSIINNYYKDKNFSHIPMLVRFVKEQLLVFIEKYVEKYESLPTNVRPICTPGDEQCKIGEGSGCIDTTANLGVVQDRYFNTVEELNILDEMLKKYILYTPCLQKSLNLELAKAKMRITIGLYESTLADVINDVKELSYKYLSKTIVPTSDRSTLSSLKDISGVNDISIAYSLHLTNLTYESISKFVDIYVENIDLQQYFIRSIKDVYNAYNFMVKDDISNAFDNLKQSIETDANTVEKNASLAKTYSGYYKLIADNKEAAYTEYDRTSTLKNNVLTLLSKFKMDRVLAKPILELSADVLSANVVDAESIAINTRSDLVLKPISDAYTAHQEEITNGVRGILQNEISKFEAEITKLGTLANFLSDDVKTAANALKSTPNDKTPDATLSTSNIIDKINKYKQLMDSVKTQTDPIKGTVYEQARAQTGAIIDRYVLHFQQVARISNGAILVYKPTETSPNLGTINQIQAQANYDKTQLAKSSNVEVFYNMYVQKEKTLLETLYAYGISIIDDGFLPLYKTIEEKGLESYISDTMKNAKADVDANRNKMENKTMVFDDTLQILTTYANISENTKLEVKRAEARQVIEKVIALLEEIATAGITINYSDIIPDTDSAKKALTNVSIVKTLPILQQVIDQYTSVLASIETQFNAYASNIIQDFITFYKDAEQQNIIDFLPEAAKTAALTADADLASVNKKTKIEVAAFIEKYSDAKLVGEKAFSDSKTAISLRRIQNQTLTYITTFKTNLAAARDISSLLADLATLDASVQKDTETVNSKSVSTTTLSSLQKTYYTLNNQVTTKVKQALIDTVTTFTRAVASAKAKAATIPTKVRLAAATFVADIKKAEAGGLTVLEMRDMQRNYAELTALVAGGLPASADLTAGRSELLQMIQTFETLVGSVGSAKVTFTSGVKQANPTADRATTEKASRIEDILALRTKYVQMIYEVTTKLEEAREAAKAALDAKKTEATAAITSFQSQIAKTAIKLADYPQVTSARDAIDRSLQILADPSTTLETATSLLDTYKTAMDTLNYGQSASSASDRAAKQQVTLLGMSRFTEVYKSNLDVASRFSTSLRTLALSLPSDITTVQSPTTALGDLDAIRKKYDDATTQILTELVGIQQDKVSETIALVRTFIQQYNQVPNIDVLPSYLRLDVRLMNADLDTLGSPAVSETTINELRQKYEGWSKALIAAVPNVSQRLYATSADKERLGNTLRELNQLFMENMGVFGSVSTQLRNRIQKIADVARYIRGDSVGSAEVTGLLEDYRAALEEFKGVLLGKPVTQSVVDASLKAILAKFVDTYKESDIYKLGKEEFNYIQLLVRNQTNVYVTQDVAGAIKAYSRGIDLLKTVPKAGQVTENAPYNKLVETINYFMSEWSLRNLGRAIANDRLYLTNLKNNATSYTELYKTPPPNLKNYGVIVDGLVDQYLQGLRLLRTYPLKK